MIDFGGEEELGGDEGRERKWARASCVVRIGWVRFTNKVA